MGQVTPKTYKAGFPAPPKAKPSAAEIANSKQFIAACADQGVAPTIRQARAYRAKQGRWKK